MHALFVVHYGFGDLRDRAPGTRWSYSDFQLFLPAAAAALEILPAHAIYERSVRYFVSQLVMLGSLSFLLAKQRRQALLATAEDRRKHVYVTILTSA